MCLTSDSSLGDVLYQVLHELKGLTDKQISKMSSRQINTILIECEEALHDIRDHANHKLQEASNFMIHRSMGDKEDIAAADSVPYVLTQDSSFHASQSTLFALNVGSPGPGNLVMKMKAGSEAEHKPADCARASSQAEFDHKLWVDPQSKMAKPSRSYVSDKRTSQACSKCSATLGDAGRLEEEIEVQRAYVEYVETYTNSTIEAAMNQRDPNTTTMDRLTYKRNRMALRTALQVAICFSEDFRYATFEAIFKATGEGPKGMPVIRWLRDPAKWL